MTLTSVTEHHASRSLDAEQAAAIGAALVELRPALQDTVASLTVSKGRHNQYLLGWKERGAGFGLLFDADELRDPEVIERRLLAARRYKLPPEPSPPSLKPAIQFNARGDARPIVHWDWEEAAEAVTLTDSPEEEAMPDTTAPAQPQPTVNGPTTMPQAPQPAQAVSQPATSIFERLGQTVDGRQIVAVDAASLQGVLGALAAALSVT